MEEGKEKVLLVNKTLHKNGGSDYFLFCCFSGGVEKGVVCDSYCLLVSLKEDVYPLGMES